MDNILNFPKETIVSRVVPNGRAYDRNRIKREAFRNPDRERR